MADALPGAFTFSSVTSHAPRARGTYEPVAVRTSCGAFVVEAEPGGERITVRHLLTESSSSSLGGAKWNVLRPLVAVPGDRQERPAAGARYGHAAPFAQRIACLRSSSRGTRASRSSPSQGLLTKSKQATSPERRLRKRSGEWTGRLSRRERLRLERHDEQAPQVGRDVGGAGCRVDGNRGRAVARRQLGRYQAATKTNSAVADGSVDH